MMKIDTLRNEVSEIIGTDPASLPDSARLLEDLGLDSLTLMRLLIWAEARGATGDMWPCTIGEVLKQVEKAQMDKVSLALDPDRFPSRAVAVEPVDPVEPVLQTRFLNLSPITNEDLHFLYTLAAHPYTAFRWRYRGTVPPFEHFVREFHTGVLVQFVVRSNMDNSPVGHVIAYNPDETIGRCYMGSIFHPGETGRGTAAEATHLFARYLFHSFPLRKICLEVPGYNWETVRSGDGHFFEVEGIQRDHLFYAGRYWDQYQCAVFRPTE